jgi:hypothetical protein
MALDDILAGTVVVNAAATTDEVIAGGEVMPLTLGVWLAIMLPVAAAIGAAYVAISAFHDYQRRYTSPRADSGASSVPRPASKLARGSP